MSIHPLRPGDGPVDRGSGGGEDGRMETRVKRLEDAVADMKVDIRVIKETMATKTDLAHMETTMVKWMVGTMFTSAGLAFAIAKFFLHP